MELPCGSCYLLPPVCGASAQDGPLAFAWGGPSSGGHPTCGQKLPQEAPCPQADQMPSAPCPQVTSRPLLPVLRPPHCHSFCLFPSLYHHPRLHAPPGQAAPSPYKAPRTQHLLTAAHRPGREGWTSGWVAGEGYRTRGSRLQELLPSCAHHQLPVAQPTGTESPF